MNFPRARTLVLATLLASTLAGASGSAQNTSNVPKNHDHTEWTVAQLQAAMSQGNLTSEKLTKEYIQRIMAMDQSGPGVNFGNRVQSRCACHGAPCLRLA
jgi:hypothetical protein